ncbi:hypothetical protein AGR7A_pAt20293 [Agrobacterium deltaense NCPPB 1641]|uniref:Uncharacterized protein n=1 Tax=Agrobacterium deltaense NCPPB 1641 TaxID=1183425 RepID=A0A1S7U9P1_9HYPH|nr:hypothetical protein AGR7A_pAt20293 [Agrobacterium deltaense NCPPB 1641]
MTTTKADIAIFIKNARITNWSMVFSKVDILFQVGDRPCGSWLRLSNNKMIEIDCRIGEGRYLLNGRENAIGAKDPALPTTSPAPTRFNPASAIAVEIRTHVR